jgi:hypothetical protein
MMKPIHAVSVAAIVSTLLGTPVSGQGVADITAKGGTKLAKNEVQSLISGATLVGLTRGGGELTIRLEPDGSVNGTLFHLRGRTSMTFGTWRVNDAGQLCERITASPSPFRVDDCFDIYQAGSEYFLVLGKDVFPYKIGR